MELILVSRDPELGSISNNRPIAGLAVNVTQFNSINEALAVARLTPVTLVAFDLRGASIDPAICSQIDRGRLVTLGPRADPRLAVLQHLEVDSQGNFWTVLLLLGLRLESQQLDNQRLDAPVATATRPFSTNQQPSNSMDANRGGIIDSTITYAISERASNGLIAVNEQGKVSDASEQLIATFQEGFGSPVNQSITELMGQCQRNDLQEFIRDAAPGTVSQFEFIDSRQNPPVTWLILGHLIITDNTPYLVGVVRNITPRRQAEAAVRDAAAKNQAILDALPDGVSVLDHEFTITACNQALTDLLGYPPGSLIGQHVSVLTGREYWAKRRSEMLDALEHHNDFGERRIYHRDGHSIAVEVHQTSIGSDHQRQYFATFRDLRDRQAAQRQQLAHETRYQTIFSAIPHGIAITTQAGEFLEVNPAYCDLAGYSQDELLGKNIAMLADNQDELERFYQAIIAQQQAYAHPQATRRDGQMITMDAYGALIPAIENDAPPEVIISHRDLTALTDAERSRKALSEKFDRLVTTTPLAMFELDLAANIVSWNSSAEKLFGYSATEACQLTLKDITPPARHDNVDKVWDRVMDNPRPLFYTGESSNRVGEIIECEWHITPILDDRGSLVSIITLLNDITNRRLLESQVRQAQKMEALGRLAGGIAHDFNNLLTGILGYSELAAGHSAAQSDTTLLGYITATHQAGIRGRDLIRQMLNYSRAQPVELQTLNPEPVVTEVLDMLGATLPSTVVIERNIEAKLPAIKVDPTQLHQVLMNICINARDAMPGGHGTLQISLGRQQTDKGRCDSCQQLFAGEHLRITVEDNGCGIPEEIIKEIFNPFFTTKEVGKGTGMGLAAADGIIHSFNGHLTVRSQEQTGTRFDIYLPITEDEQLEIAPAINTSPQPPAKKQHLLVVDDEPAVLAVLMALFSDQGYRVTGCPSATEALEKFTADNTAYDLVITDHTMPTMTGTELAAKLYRHAPNTPVILCTGYMANTEPDPDLPANIREQLLKPVASAELFTVVHRLLTEKTAKPPAPRGPPPAA